MLAYSLEISPVPRQLVHFRNSNDPLSIKPRRRGRGCLAAQLPFGAYECLGSRTILLNQKLRAQRNCDRS